MASADVLVSIPGATVYKVLKSSHAVTDVANGEFQIISQGDDGGLVAQVGPVSWRLGRWAASLRFDDHTYAFQLPHLPYDSAEAHYYCVTLRPDTPEELVDLLQAVLSSGSAYHDQPHLQQQQQQAQPQPVAPPAAAPTAAPSGPARGPASPRHTSTAQDSAARGGSSDKADRLAAGLRKGGLLAAAGVMVAATWASGAIQKGAEAAVTRLQPSERQHPNLSPEAQARLERAKSVAAKAAAVSGRAVSGALSLTAQVAGALAQRISATDVGQRMSSARVAGASAQDIRRVGVAGVEAVEAVYDSLAEAARLVLAHVSTAAARVAGHTYGPGAAQATGASFHVAQSVVQTGINVAQLRPTRVIKQVAKGTATAVVLGDRPAASAGSAAAAATAGGAVVAATAGAGAGAAAAGAPQAAAAAGAVAVAAAAAGGGCSASWSGGQAAGAHRAGSGSGSSAGVAAAGGSPYPQILPAAAGSVLTMQAVQYAAAGGPSTSGASASGAYAPRPAVSAVQYGTAEYGAGAAGSAPAPAVGVAVSYADVVDGVVVDGPAPAHPVAPVMDYHQRPGAAAAADGAQLGPSGLPYPPLSAGQYAARYYPAVPRAS